MIKKLQWPLTTGQAVILSSSWLNPQRRCVTALRCPDRLPLLQYEELTYLPFQYCNDLKSYSDAPDSHEPETEVRRKILRFYITDALSHPLTVEILLYTPIEAQISPPQDPGLGLPIVRVLPFPILTLVEPYTSDEDQDYRIATPAEAKLKRRRCSWLRWQRWQRGGSWGRNAQTTPYGLPQFSHDLTTLESSFLCKIPC